MAVRLSVGTPPQEMSCLLDSGSSDFWVPSKHCRNCVNEHHFSAESSSTFMAKVRNTYQGPRPVEVGLEYGSGKIIGYVVQDTVHVDSVTLPNQSFIIVEDAMLPPHRNWDGICGLGWKRLAAETTPLYKGLQKQMGSAVIGLVPEGGRGSYMTVGAQSAEAACQPSTLSWSPLVKVGGEKSFWVIEGGLAIHKKTPTKVNWLVDTGTSFILVPPKVFTSLIGSIFPKETFDQKCGMDQLGGVVICHCSVMNAPGMLPLRIQLGGREFALPVTQLFKKVHKNSGAEELCILQAQPNPMAATAEPLGVLQGILGGARPGVVVGGETAGAEGPGGGAGQGGAMPMPPFPFPFPFPMGPLGNGSQGGGFPFPMPSAGGGPMAVGEQVEEQISTMPDGSVCKHVLVWEGKTLKRNETTCQPPGSSADIGAVGVGGLAQAMAPFMSGRRLSFGGIPIPMPFGGMPGQAETAPDMMESSWILGGVFLEHFVTIFDFDRERLGFCAPSGSTAESIASEGFNALPQQNVVLPLQQAIGPQRDGRMYVVGGIVGVAAVLGGIALVSVAYHGHGRGTGQPLADSLSLVEGNVGGLHTSARGTYGRVQPRNIE